MSSNMRFGAFAWEVSFVLAGASMGSVALVASVVQLDYFLVYSGISSSLAITVIVLRAIKSSIIPAIELSELWRFPRGGPRVFRDAPA